jgi:hypothetical protein
VKIDWARFFIDSIEAARKDLTYIAGKASGCREGWLQGTILLAANKRGYDLRANECRMGRRGKADISFGDPPTMIAEIKIVGADFQSKMRHAIDADVDRLRKVRAHGIERYMIVVIRESTSTGILRAYLDSWPSPSEGRELKGKGFCLKILRV